MAEEIERKFLVIGDAWRVQSTCVVEIRQNYLASSTAVVVRIRQQGDKAFLTVKSKTPGISRAEFEYAIPPADADALLGFCDGAGIHKHRHTLVHGGRTWVIDDYAGALAGFVMAEIELERVDAAFERPPWLGAEVTDDPRYRNEALATGAFDPRADA